MDGLCEAAIHFTHYLCSSNIVTRNATTVSKSTLKEVFSNDYQPRFAVHFLKPGSLVSALSKAGVLTKNPSHSDMVQFDWAQLENLGISRDTFPEKPPSRLTKPKHRIIVSQSFAFRENLEKPDNILSDKCELCKVSISDANRIEHLNDEGHRVRTMYRKNRKELEKIKHKIGVWMADSNPDSREGQDVKVTARPGVKVNIDLNYMSRLDKNLQPLLLQEIIALCTSKDITMDGTWPIELQSGVIQVVHIHASFASKGHMLYPLVFKLLDRNTGLTEYYLKDVTFYVQSDYMDELIPAAPYTSSIGPVLKTNEYPIIYGVPATMPESDLSFDFGMKNTFPIPKVLFRFLNNGFKNLPDMTESEKATLKKMLSLLPSGTDMRSSLTEKNYSGLLALLLHIEEHKLNHDIHYYDMAGVSLKQKGDGLWLKVAGLSEKRPSLLINDSIYVNYMGDQTACYEGRIHKMTKSSVLLGFNRKFENDYKGEPLEVQFSINRSNLKNMHRALHLTRLHHAETIFFPSKRGKPTHQPPLRPWHNKEIENNPEQQRAVRHVVWQTAQQSPYLVFGPPGTGKTSTIVEIILQLWEPISSKNRLLVCAPSNSAADVLTSRLITGVQALGKKPTDQIFRMYALSRTLQEVPPLIKTAEVTNHDLRTGEVFFPRKEVIMSYSIVVCTFSCAARLVSAKIPAGHFTHIIMDEVGQAMEPEALIPIIGLGTSVSATGTLLSHIVMAGDPKQLGPIIQSPLAVKFGLDKSMLERFMEMDIYQKSIPDNMYDSNMLTKLLRNYRSHKQLLHISNKLFYDNELMAEGNPLDVNAACEWQGLAKKNFPLIFHGVEGQDEREGNSPSFFNRLEIDVVMEYVQKILKDKIASEREIGIVTPYRMQVKKINKALALLKISDVSVGSVEQFQGQERKVIIISTVRSRSQFLAHDYKYQLGFLKNPKRFNVAVTRARALLIAVGNPNVLQHDPCWLELLKFCQEEKVYIGLPFTVG